MCQAEWDKAWNDFTSFNEWNMLVDPTLMYYRPLSNYVTRESDGHWRYGHPTAESLRAPDSQKMEYGDGEWCANGYHNQAGTGYVICGSR